MRSFWILVIGFLLTGCGFGFADDSQKAIPDASYWGWQCVDHSAPDPDAGCPPSACGDAVLSIACGEDAG
jgi:hypothetical protein